MTVSCIAEVWDGHLWRWRWIGGVGYVGMLEEVGMVGMEMEMEVLNVVEVLNK